MASEKFNNLIKALEIKSNNDLVKALKNLEHVKGLDADPLEVAQILKNDPEFQESVRGADGYCPTVEDIQEYIEPFIPVKGIHYFDGKPGMIGKPGKPGVDGYTPVFGIDYFTQSQVSDIENNVTVRIETSLLPKLEKTIDERLEGIGKTDLSDYLTTSQANDLVRMAVLNGGTSVLSDGRKVGTAHNINFIGATVSAGANGAINVQFSGGSGNGITDLTGDVTATGPGSATATIANDAVTFAKMQNVTQNRLLGRYGSGSGDIQQILIGSGLTLDTGTGTLFTTDNASTQRVEVAKNSGAVVGTRKQLNFIEGSNVTLTIADDIGNDQIDITIDSTGGGGITVGTTTITSGTNTRIPFNDSGVYQEDSAFTWNKTNDVLTVNGIDLYTKNVSSLHLGDTNTAWTGTAITVLGRRTIESATFTGNNVSILGYFSGRTLTTGTGLVLVGDLAGSAATTMVGTTAVGSNALANGNSNNSFYGGMNSGINATGAGNVLIGVNTGIDPSFSAAFNMGIGVSTLRRVTTSPSNSGIGSQALQFLTSGSGFNVSIGADSGQTAATSAYLTLIGATSDVSTSSLSSGIAVGYGAILRTANTAVFGGDGANGRITDSYFGNGQQNASPINHTIHATNARGGTDSNATAASLTLASGLNTGTGAVPSVLIATGSVGSSGSVLSTLVNRVEVNEVRTRVYNRLQGSKGANVAAANDLTLGSDGNAFTITGNTQINAITTTGWQAGSHITLLFTGTPTVKHNTSGGGGTAVLFLAGSGDLSAANNTVLGLFFDGTQWQETFRKVA